MQLTQYTDYSLRVLIYLGLHGDSLVTINDIADCYDISRNHLVKVAHQLGKFGYIETQRGKNGGIRLRLAPSEINIGEVVRHCEENLTIVECFSEAGSCAITPSCRLRGVLREALNSFMRVLDGYSLQDLLVNQRKLKNLLRKL